MDFKLDDIESQWKPAGKDIAEKLVTHYWQKGNFFLNNKQVYINQNMIFIETLPTSTS